MPDQLGSARKQHPLPMRLRSCMIEKDQGGSKGYRGPGFSKARRRALYKAKHRSFNTGLRQGDVKLEVDHIHPYRQGGISSHTNEQTNLRVTDFDNNKYTDYAEGFQEKVVKRRLERF
jgi:hypothetical protein